MLSNQVLHKIAQSIYKAAGLECSIWDTQGSCLVTTGERAKQLEREVLFFLETADISVRGNLTGERGIFLVCDDDEPMYVLVLQGGDISVVRIAGELGVSQLESLISAYKERMDKNRFIQNLILDNMLLVDIYNQAEKMRIPVEQRRAVFMIEPKNEGENIVLETMRGLYATGNKDFVTAVDERHIILVKALESTEDYPDLTHIARVLVDTLNMEAMVSVRVAFSTIVAELKDVSRSYKEAQMALEVGRVFYADKNVLAYNELGIGRLIHQLPPSLCQMFLKEVFEKEGAAQFEEEELITVFTFFDNNLNISETARQLYIHRNTLVYRLEKIQKKTGLDVRVFDDALTFKIAMMVSDHMKNIES